MNLFDVVRTYRCPWTNSNQAYFAIIHTPRAGSNYLVELLDSAEGITCHAEIFSRNSTYLSRQTDVPYIDMATRDRDLWRFLGYLVGHAAKADAFGFKIGLYDLRAMLVYVLLSRRVRKLVICRRNLLAAFVSSKRANASGAWIQWNNTLEGEERYRKINISISQFLIYYSKRKIFYTFVALCEIITWQKHMRLYYEDVINSSNIDDILRFLHLRGEYKFVSQTKKQNKRPLREQIQNIDRVDSFMNLINAGWMLNE